MGGGGHELEMMEKAVELFDMPPVGTYIKNLAPETITIAHYVLDCASGVITAVCHDFTHWSLQDREEKMLAFAERGWKYSPRMP